jgi:hypothetical protein
MESGSPIIIQMLKNVKQIIDVSKERNCWKDEELKYIGTTYHNVCEIYKQLQGKQTQDKGLEDIIDDPVLEEPEPELDESIEIN